eukprot:scaffold73319_cov72-Phaeocystis_antarctica.AAC.2
MLATVNRAGPAYARARDETAPMLQLAEIVLPIGTADARLVAHLHTQRPTVHGRLDAVAVGLEPVCELTLAAPGRCAREVGEVLVGPCLRFEDGLGATFEHSPRLGV